MVSLAACLPLARLVAILTAQVIPDIMSRPGVAKVLDPAAAALFICGDEILPPEQDTAPEAPPNGAPKKLLHVFLKTTGGAGDDVQTDSEEDVLSDPEEILAQEDRLEERVEQLKRKEGLSSERTLKHAFKLMDCLIGQYKLNRTEEILDEFESVCVQKGSNWKVKHIQSSAFVKWKQYKFKEALALFLMQQEIVGASAALCENIGHTYSSLGDLTSAEDYFERAIELLKRGSFGNKGGIYMGLGLVRDRLGKTREALPILQQALEHYQQEHTKGHVQLDSSIIAKVSAPPGVPCSVWRAATAVPSMHARRACKQSMRPRTSLSHAHRAESRASTHIFACMPPSLPHLSLTPSLALPQAHMSLGKAHEKLGDAKAAQKHMRDALAIFRRTVGYDSPLTANAMGALGKVTAQLGDHKEVGPSHKRPSLCSPTPAFRCTPVLAPTSMLW